MVELTMRVLSVVKPAGETPKVCLWTSNIDRMFSLHAQAVYFYRRPTGSPAEDFFSSTVLKDGLAKALLTYYPIAGRLKRNDQSGRLEIDCNGEGVMFIEAQTDSHIEDLGDFTPNEQLMPLIPSLDTSTDDISACPPFLVQVTHFKCGGVCLSTSMIHTVADGVSSINFINRWSDLCRGVQDDNKSSVPFFDRTLLRARDPPIVSFPHIEYKRPSMNIPCTSSPAPNPKIAVAKLNISTMQANQLKSKCNKDEFQFSTYEVIAGHLWRCSCRARQLKDDQETTILIPLDARSRTIPPLPHGYFGNAIFYVTPAAISGDIVSKPLSYAVGIIRETFMMSGNNEYFRSALDFLELHPNIRALTKGAEIKACNINNSSWVRLPIYGADFGWGQPFYVGPGVQRFAGRSMLIPNPPGSSDGGFSLIISLESDYHMNLFKEYFYRYLI